MYLSLVGPIFTLYILALPCAGEPFPSQHTEPGDYWCLGFGGFESGFSSPVTEEFWQWVGAGVSGSIQVSSKEIAGVGHEAEFRSWCGTLMTMVLYGVIGHIAGHVSPLHFCHAQLIQYSTCTLGHVLGEGGHYQWALLT